MVFAVILSFNTCSCHILRHRQTVTSLSDLLFCPNLGFARRQLNNIAPGRPPKEIPSLALTSNATIMSPRDPPFNPVSAMVDVGSVFLTDGCFINHSSNSREASPYKVSVKTFTPVTRKQYVSSGFPCWSVMHP